MPNPKRRHSHARGAKRRTHYKIELSTVSVCPRCNAARLPHVACPACGAYSDRKVEVKESAGVEG